MPTVLLRPHILGAKNHFFKGARRFSFLNKDLAFVGIGLLVMLSVYGFLSLFLSQVNAMGGLANSVPSSVMSVGLLGIFMLLLLSSFASALGIFYSSKDLPLILSAPVSSARLYFTRLTETIAQSSWMFMLFALPSVAAYTTVYQLPWTFSICAIAVGLPFLVIPAALSSIFVTIFVNLIPANKVKEVLAVIVFVFVAYLFYLSQTLPAISTHGPEGLSQVISALSVINEPQPLWMPTRWTAELLNSFVGPTPESPLLLFLMLLLTAAGLSAVGYLFFDAFFYRGWTMATQCGRALRIPASPLLMRIGSFAIPMPSQLRALSAKEIRMILRDTTQSVQLLLLLVLTFIYLYNFRSLRTVSSINIEAQSWWQAILAIANIALGACVISAVATRFVFPSVSLEGRAYNLLRSTPLTIAQLLWHKFLIWLLPISGLALVLIVSGAWAIRAEIEVVYLSAILAIAISIGVVGLGIGVGAVYAKFDWENPSQITASFGSLVYMLLSIALTFVILIPASFLIVFTTVGSIAEKVPQTDFLIVTFCSYFLIFFLNLAITHRAIAVGEQSLTDRET